MASSMLTGERRWASSRRGGMKVLGKVPKPVNLPSQRLESHGQNRDVDIVPKGTLIWGSKQSPSTSGAWGTSVQSPNTDGGTSSPRPSSGGSGTRPSTAGSDITHERSSASAWGPNSRPSSASGSLASSQHSLISLRPHSAETRLGSSQLSRFAESVTDNSTAWGAGAADKLGTTSSKNDKFPLTPGDFPILGLDKETSGRNIEHQDRGPQGRPGSSSGGLLRRREDFGNSVGDVSLNGNAKGGMTNSWRRETQPYGDDGARPSIEKWHAEPQPYPNSSIPPQHYDAWHGPVNNHPGGVWYRGPPGGPPFGPPVGPGGFPMEPFPYYRPQVAPPLANPPVSGGTGPRGPHPKSGDMYRPHMHDAFVRPGMPMRPGFYPGPVPYDGYYGPPLGYGNPNEREISSVGMTVGPSAYNLFSGPNAPDRGNAHMLGGYAPSNKAMALEQMESGRNHDALIRDSGSHDARSHDARIHDSRSHDSRIHDSRGHDSLTHDARNHDVRTHDAQTHSGQGKVLLKQYDCWEDQDEPQKRENIKPYSSRPGEDDRTRHSSMEGSWNVDHNKDEEADGGNVAQGGGAPWEFNDQRVLSVMPNSPVRLRNSKGDINSCRRLDNEERGAPQLPEVSVGPRNPSLMQKIEGLNAKVRVTDGLQDAKFLSGREEQKNNLQVGDSKTNAYGKGTGSGLLSHEITHKNHIPSGDRINESAVASGIAIPRKSNQNMHGRARHGIKEADGRHERYRVANSAAGSAGDVGSSADHGQERKTAEAIAEAIEISSLHPQDRVEGELSPPVPDLSDTQLQRATMLEVAKLRLRQGEKEEEERPRDKVEGELSPPVPDLSDTQLQRATMLELAKLRLRQREKEEEERARDQKAKARAKLEELNRRTRGEGSAQKLENASSTLDQNKQEERLGRVQATVFTGSARASGSVLGPKPHSVVVTGEMNTSRAEKSPSSSSEGLLEIPKTVRKEPVSIQDQSEALRKHVKGDDSQHVNGSQIHDKGVSQQKGSSHVQKQNMHLENLSADKLKSSSIAGNTTVYFGGVAVEISSSCNAGSPISAAVVTESLVQHKKKGWGGKNKQRLEESTTNPPPELIISGDKSKCSDTIAQDSVVEGVQLKTLKYAVDPSSVQPNTDSKNENQSLEQHAPSSNEDARGRVNNQWKSQHSKRNPRNPVAHRSTEKHGGDSVVWAPVRPQSKAEVSKEAGQKNVVDDQSASIKSDQQVQHSQRNRRTDMERYIPKPVAKETVHSSRQAAVPLINQASQDGKVGRSNLPKEENVGGTESGITDTESLQASSATSEKVASALESKIGDGKQSKPGKTYGPWRRRGPTESIGSFPSDHGKNLQKSVVLPETQGSDVIPGKEQSQSVDEWNISDDWNTPENPVAPATVTVAKDPGGTARGKRLPFRGQKGAGYSRDSDDKRISGVDSGKGFGQSLSVELHQVDSTRERVVGDQSISHWQPKSQVPATNQRGSWSSGSQNIVNEISRSGGKDSIPNEFGGQLPPQQGAENTASQQPAREQSLSQEVSAVGHQETRRERKNASLKGRLGRLGESSSLSDVDNQHEQYAQSGFHKNGGPNSHFLGGHESHKDWGGGPGKDYKQNSVPVNWERYRHTSHYEYQPVGPQSNSKANALEPPKDGSQNSNSRFKERSHSHSRRGAGYFHGRHSGSAQVDASDK